MTRRAKSTATTSRARGLAKVATETVRRPWTALLAASALGIGGANMLHADVQSDAGLADGRDYRLVVQSYEGADGASVDLSARPLASTQRSVTAAELRQGVRVGLLELRQDRSESDGSPAVVVAWVEEGKADLAFDGLRARPQPGSLRGAAPRVPGRADQAVHISVKPGLGLA
jgi:hypothetical protein